MSFFSDNTRVATTATPNFTVDSYKDPNVGQYGWTKSDTGHYNQLVQYVDECRKIYEAIQGAAEAIPLVIDYYNKIKEIYESVVLINSEIDANYSDFKTKYSDFQIKYEKFFSDYISFGNDFLDFTEKYEDVLVKEASAVASAAAAKASEDQTRLYRDEVKDLYDDLKDGQVYRGTWNPNSNAYPDPEGTNSSWDVVLNAGQISVVYDGKTWYNGDRLVYVQATTSFEQIATGLSGVQSVNGKTGAVTLTYTDLSAAPDGFGLGVIQPNTITDMNSDPNTWPGEGKIGWLRATSATANRPGNQAGVLMITRYAGGTGAVYVIFFGVNRRTYTRRWNGSAWQDWLSIYDSENKPGASEIGALSSSGGSLSGSLYIEGGSDLYMRSSSGSNNIIYFQDGTDSNRSLGEVYCDRNTGGMIVRSYGATTNEQAWLRIRHDETSPMYRNAAGTYALYHAGNKPTPSEIGALPDSGNVTFNGNFTVGGNLTVKGNEIEMANLNVSGELSERGHRVYSSGNKPTATDLGFFPSTGGRLNSGAEWGITMGTLDGNGSRIALEASGKLPFTLWNSTSDNAMRFGWRKADGSFDTRFAVLDDNFICNYNLSVNGAATVNGNLATNNSLFAKGKVQSDNELVVDKPGQGYTQMVMPNESGGWHSRTAYVPRGNGWAIIGAAQNANGICTGARLNVYNGSQQAEWAFTPKGEIAIPQKTSGGAFVNQYAFDGSIVENIQHASRNSYYPLTKQVGYQPGVQAAALSTGTLIDNNGLHSYCIHFCGENGSWERLWRFESNGNTGFPGGIYASLVADSGHRVYSPVNPPSLKSIVIDEESTLLQVRDKDTTLEDLILHLMKEVAELKAQLNK